ncbi:DUF6745 domain-containing protein [Nocardia cyriacigeorgica]|uniref:DUF6745 domain-containing protein n=2 Tax=Nocardia cyriacigeorgica TaxID=135487 RepID=UPI0013D87DED|nr:hypothetical protein [Nocardia cyriacigeorgica]NEW25707.1 hypothetical protein [Nocardia cyriacigeorgica]
MSVLGQREAANIRKKWLGRMLCTEPADRRAAEAAISEIYELAGLGPPRFRWVSSPLIARATGEPGAKRGPRPITSPEPAVVQLLSRIHSRMRVTIGMSRREYDRWACALEPFEQNIAGPLTSSWAGTIGRIIMAAGGGPSSIRNNAHCGSGSVVWSDFPPNRAGEHARAWELWAAVAAACGPWWPDEDLCVVSERPEILAAEDAGDRGRLRLHCADGPAIRYSDGWELFFWHGTQVPGWVITDPTAEAIDRETNVEVRRCAIERLGWPAYVEEAGMELLACAPDPGNHGYELMLYELPDDQRVLVAVNGSVERDGTRRRYGLTVPRYLTDPVDAAAWTYGLTGTQYSQLLHRT